MVRTMLRLFSRGLCVALVGLVSALVMPTQAQAISPDSVDAKAIMAAVEKRNRGDRVLGRIVMTITDNAGRKRQRVVRSWQMDFSEGTRQLMMFESPADVKGTGMLSLDYTSGDRDDDQWLYLPSLNKSTRISSGEKSGSFMGTDLSYADMTKTDPSHYAYSVVKPSVKLKNGEDCWLIESRPTTAKAKNETGYVKSRVWVSKSKLVPMQVKAWVREGKKLKFIKFGQYEKFGEIWLPKKISARTKRGKKTESTTTIQFTELKLDHPEINDGMFTQRRLEQGL